MAFLREFARFIAARKKYWLVPVLVIMVAVGGLLVFSQGSVVSPLIYTLFSPAAVRPGGFQTRPMKKYSNAIRVVAVNLIVLIVLLGGIEFYFRHWGHEQPDGLKNGLWQTFQPYVMITTAPGDYQEF